MTKIDQKGRIILGDSMKSKDKGKKYIKVTLKNVIICCSFAIIILCCISFYNYYFNKNEVYAKETNNIKTDNIKISNAQLMNLDEIVNNNTQNKQKEEYITEEVELEYITIYQTNSNLSKGVIQVIQEGREGKQQITKKKTYENGEIISEEQVNSKITKAAVNKIVEVGTNNYKSNYKVKIGDVVYVTSDRAEVMTEPNENTQKVATLVKGKELKIIVESSTYQNNKVGNYSIILKATDSYGLESKIELKVHVIDITAPKIVQNKDVRIPYGQKITEQELLAYFTITDNVGVISNKFILPTGFEFDKALSYGKYNLTLESKDSSSNTKRFSFVVDVYDGTAPVFSRKNGQISDPITVGYSESLNYDINNIINLFEAVDAIDGNCDIYLKSGRLKMIIGSHVLVLGAKDKVNNESTLSIVVTVVNDIPPIFILSDKIIQTSPARPLTVEQIKQVLENHILKNNFVKNIEFDASEYLNNTDVEGEYIVSYSYLNQNNEKVEDTFEIIVKGDSQAKNTRVSIWTKIRIFFEKLWNWICGRGFKANSEL